MTTEIVTRFAPSPTGFLHIGGARTALFNWLFAKANGGKMLLRIEDTDQERSTEEAVSAILDGLSWLGLDWDGDPISQYSRKDRHQEVAKTLVENGAAYYCYASAQELTAMREEARAQGRPPIYDGRWRDRSPDEAPEGVDPVVRIKTPKNQKIEINDSVQGLVTFDTSNLDDFVILRSDGSPTYMLAVVVDDHDMGVTHIIRGDDHLTNAARQTLLFNAMGWDVPVMAHIPLIHGPDGAKLSKRHGALGAEAYRAMGYLPAALRNYLVRLGWAHGDQEKFSTDEMISLFSLDAVGKSAARFDFQKLEHLNGQYIREEDDQSLLEAFLSILPEIEGGSDLAEQLDDETKATLAALMPALKERAKTLLELKDGASFLFASRPLKMTEKASKLMSDEARQVLGGLVDHLAQVNDWSLEATDAAVRQYAEDSDLKLGKVAQPLRAALTGSTISPGIFDVLAALGKEESLARIGDQT